MKPRFLTLLTLIVLSLFYGQDLKSQPKLLEESDFPSVEIEHYHFSDYNKDAQIWNAMYIGSNNKIYIGLCTHADAANLYEFDIETRKMRLLANLTEILDERGRAIWTNGKIHVRMQELDGYVYFGSFCEDNGPPAIDARTYGGPHWFRVRMSDGNVEVLSKINSFWGLIGQELDKERRIVYGLSENGNLYRYFIDEVYTEDLGCVDRWDICRTIFKDDVGNIYGSYPPGRIWKYDPEKNRIFDLEFLKLPVSGDGRSMANPMLDRRSQWRYIEWDPTDKVAYGIIGGNNLLFKFDVKKGLEGEITPLATICAPQYRNGHPRNIPHSTLAFTISQKERKVYFIPVLSGDFDYGAVDFGLNKEGESDNKNLPPLSYMVSYNLKNGHINDLGLMQSKDGIMAYGMGAAETDSQGRIWFVGAFEEPDKKFVARNIGDYPYSMGLGCYDPNK